MKIVNTLYKKRANLRFFPQVNKDFNGKNLICLFS